MSLRKMLKGLGTQVMFSVLPVGDWDSRRRSEQDTVPVNSPKAIRKGSSGNVM